MNDILFEQQIVQNPGIGAEAIWHAVNATYEGKHKAEGMPILLAFIVLSLVFHKRSATTLASKTRPGALYKAIASDREITIGLQQRMESMSDLTLQSLSVAFSTELLFLDKDGDRQLIPGRKTPPVVHITEDVKILLAAAKRIGQAIEELPTSQIVTHLNIRF